MLRYVLVSLLTGVVFGVLDGVINANRLAQRLYEVYKPIARESVDAPLGVAVDLLYGFVMAALFLILYESLPGSRGFWKGVSFGLIAWFFRVVMSVMGSWVTFRVPGEALFYSLLTGLAEMLILGMLYGLLLRPAPGSTSRA